MQFGEMPDGRAAVPREPSANVKISSSVRKRSHRGWSLIHCSKLEVGVAGPVAIEPNQAPRRLAIELCKHSERIHAAATVAGSDQIQHDIVEPIWKRLRHSAIRMQADQAIR